MTRTDHKIVATAQTSACFPLTVGKPNALLRIFNKTLLEYAIDFALSRHESLSVVVLSDHYSLFRDAGLTGRARFDIIDDISMMDNADGEQRPTDAARFYPDTSGTSLPVKYSWDLLSLQEQFAHIIMENNQGQVETNATIKGTVSLGRGTVVKSGAYLEGNIITGENCIIGPNCFIRGTCSIGDNCRIGNAVEIKNSILGNDVFVSHLSYLGDSIIGDGCNIGAGFISSNLRHDNAVIVTRLRGEKINTGRIKLGTITGDGVHTGINTSVYPGRKIWPGLNTLPGSIVDRDIEE
jgi:UDP-N-acetylglucosamine diphosphorylase / glucose-1-phosphate thymidylyltransferase / UDP-N-acetylgalactosamine diphosphorylase / glucosamine-1-phosphate N-acetyltransferase / galactosamine-1-phosphate N-acetyltransferase